MVMRVGVVGAYGRMGESISRTIESDPELTLSARIGSSDPLKQLADAGTDIVVDVTNLDAARKNLPWFAMHGMHVIVGTSGLTDADISELQRAFENSGKVCFVVPNFSIAAVLSMRFAEESAPYFDGVEIIEVHHDQKKDAPSGMATATADRIAKARGDKPWRTDPTELETVERARGGLMHEGINVHSLRLPGRLAHQEVIFGSAGQTLTIRYDSIDRSSFMPGVVRSVKSIGTLPPGVTVGLEAVL
jgi:4-hydroxy-tetrahydrodipicolinate reductase